MSKKILIVDDDKDILEPLAIILESYGYVVQAITKGKLVSTRVTLFHPDIILLDILMSGSDGRTICKKLKSDKNTQNIRIIMMSAHPYADRDSKDAGADDFLAKPFETQELLGMLNKHISD